MSLTFTFDPPATPDLRDGVLDLWTDVSNAGGSVGFVPPVTREDIRPELVRHMVGMAEGRTRLLVGHDETGQVAATAFLALNTHRLMTHWLWFYTVMVHPRHQGRGYGRDLMAAAAYAARTVPGIEAIRLTCRGRPRPGAVLRVLRLQGGRPGARRDPRGAGRRPGRRLHAAAADLSAFPSRTDPRERSATRHVSLDSASLCQKRKSGLRCSATR